MDKYIVRQVYITIIYIGKRSIKPNGLDSLKPQKNLYSYPASAKKFLITLSSEHSWTWLFSIDEFTGDNRVQKCSPFNLVPYNEMKHCCVQLFSMFMKKEVTTINVYDTSGCSPIVSFLWYKFNSFSRTGPPIFSQFWAASFEFKAYTAEYD